MIVSVFVICDVCDAEFWHSGDISTLFLKWTLSKNANIFSRYHVHLGEMLNISSANDSTFTVFTTVFISRIHLLLLLQSVIHTAQSFGIQIFS